MQNKRFWFSVITVSLLTASFLSTLLPAQTFQDLMIAVIIGFLGVQSWTDIQKTKRKEDEDASRKQLIEKLLREAEEGK